jgi:predicted O-linked N-acetylglucosamine transferase (SPINDLY family)
MVEGQAPGSMNRAAPPDLRELLAAGRLDEARSLCRQLCDADGSRPELWSALAVIHGRMGDPAAAVECARRALEFDASSAEAHFNLATALSQLKEFGAAGRHVEEAIKLAPLDENARMLGARIHSERGDHARAEGHCRQALARNPGSGRASLILGQLLEARGDLEGACSTYRAATDIRPELIAVWNALGCVLERLRRPDEAVEAYKEALARRPNEPAVLNNLGNALRTQGRFTEAEVAYRAGLALAPASAELLNNVGGICASQARYDEAEAALRSALGLKPDFTQAHSNLVFWMNYNPSRTVQEIFAAHVGWGTRHGVAVPRVASHVNLPDAERRLRVGYVSPDFRRHAVAYFVEPVLRAHDRSRFEVICYAEVPSGDNITERFRSLSDGWRQTCGMTDEALAATIESDAIDILVDLAGHTRGNRLPVFARKPAPVQVNFLGYCNTSGLESMDWRVTDRTADPAGAERFYTERLRRLEPCFFCYGPPGGAPEVSALPAMSSGTITFGSLSTPAKIGTAVIDLWVKVLHACSGSRLLIARRSLKGEVRTRFERAFASAGIGPGRVELCHAIPSGFQSHLGVYGRIDISLDTFPWSGHTTSCEALYMGVPTVTLTGDRHASRMVASLLRGVGLPHLVADTPEAYITIARNLAADIPALARLRAGLRAQFLASPVCDAEGFTRKLEAAYRDMWRAWCNGNLRSNNDAKY